MVGACGGGGFARVLGALTRACASRQDAGGGKIDFWDVVVITASDEEQARTYLEQVRWRQELGQIPMSCAYHVVPDPPGCKIGNGGATLVVLDFLRAQAKFLKSPIYCDLI